MMISLGSALSPDLIPGERRGWLLEKRRDALRAFNERGLPTRRDEDWRYTNLTLLSQIEFTRNRTRVADIDADSHALFDAKHRIVFVNGVFDADLSRTDSLPEGCWAVTAEHDCEHVEPFLSRHLGQLTDIEDDAFAALNTALFEDIVAVYIEKGRTLDEPLYVLSILTGDEPLLVNPRTLIVVEPGASATVVEDFVSTGGAPHLTNALTEIFIGAEADVHHYTLERENDAACNVSTLKSKQDEGSRFSSHTILLGGSLVRNNVNPRFEGENCWSLLNGIYIGEARQHMDNMMRVEHRSPHCDSRQFYRGVLRDRAQGVFGGRIIVSPGAQKTDAVQSSQGLLLSEDARILNKPQLEIYADDVKCTHGATVGELDDNALFYLRSRGIDEATARALMVFAFVGESIGRIENTVLRESITDLILDKLPNSRTLEEVVLNGD